MNRAKNVVKYYVLCNKLKDVIRTGWKNWNVKRERIESVAEHIFGTQSLAIAMYSEYKYDIDLEKVIYMLAVHELEEILIGDFNPFEITEEEKEKIGHKAVSEILSDLLNKDEIYNLIIEFDKKETNEAKFAYHCDKLECDLQCKLYDEENCVSLDEQIANDLCENDEVKLLLDQEKSWSKMWIEYHRKKFKDDKNFEEIIDYIKSNKINVK